MHPREARRMRSSERHWAPPHSSAPPPTLLKALSKTWSGKCSPSWSAWPLLKESGFNQVIFCDEFSRMLWAPLHSAKRTLSFPRRSLYSLGCSQSEAVLPSFCYGLHPRARGGAAVPEAPRGKAVGLFFPAFPGEVRAARLPRS